MNRTAEWVSTHSFENEKQIELLTNDLEHSIPEWLARINISSINDDESSEFHTPMEIEYSRIDSKLG